MLIRKYASICFVSAKFVVKITTLMECKTASQIYKYILYVCLYIFTHTRTRVLSRSKEGRNRITH